MRLSILLLFLLLLVGTKTTAGSRCIGEERDALFDFKATLKDPQELLSSWKGLNCCSWYGVTCHKKNGHIIKLDLGNNNFSTEYALTGDISPSLTRLTHLEYLDLHRNDFGGASIPKFMGSLKNLRYLDLHGAGFGWKIPPQLGNLSKLNYLDIGFPTYNFGSDASVDSIYWLSGLSSLTYLDMSWWNLSAASDWLESLNMLASLQEVHLPFSNLQPTELYSLSQSNITILKIIDLSSNNFNSTFPYWLTGIQSISEINLAGCGLHGLIPKAVRNLTQLEYLDLSDNDFGGANIPGFIGTLKNLRHLDLSSAGFGGKIPPQLGNLSWLNYLDISYPNDRFTSSNSVDNLLWLSQLSSLAYLDMSWGWNLSSASDWLESLNMLASLQELKLVCTDLPSTNLNSLSQSNFKVLSKIDLSCNNLNSTFPYWLTSVQTVAYIDLSFCGLYGSIPEAIGNLSALRDLHLSTNSLEGTIPISIGRLCELRYLDLSKNNLAGDIDNFGKAMAACMKELFSINLGSNNLSGSIPRWLGSFRKLSSVDLSNNSLTGHVPSNINQLTNLIHLDISSNFLQGVLSEEHLANLSILSTLSMSSNSLRISVGTNWVPPFDLIDLQLHSCPLESQFPQWLQTQTSISSIDLHNTGTKGPLPDWIWTSLTSLVSLDLSNNQITGKLPASLEHMKSLSFLGLSSNQLEGHIPNMPRSLEVLDLSNNSFSGSLPSSLGRNNLHFVFLSNNHLNGSIPMYFCDMELLSTIDLSNNRFSGELPNQWKQSTRLFDMDFSSNNLEGGIPSSIGSLTSLSSLRLSKNKLSGVLPASLSSCNRLILLDLGENHFEGPIPSWIGDSMQFLMILRLRSNQFSGNIPTGLSQLLGLQVLDLASNKLSGHVPQSIGNFTFMASQESRYIVPMMAFASGSGTSYYYCSVYVTIKGEERLYSRILNLMKSIDLSDNDLTGEIPVEIGALVGLKNLNLSRNLLHGHIPDTVGSMGSLESLDLSWNQLSGVIPQSMASLHLLSHLNMSYNNLSGQIPLGSQLQTLGDEDPYIYAGNSYLCSALVNYSCSAHNQSPIDNEDMYGHDVFLYVFSGLGFGLGFAAVWWVLLFSKGIHKWYFLSIDSMYDKSFSISESMYLQWLGSNVNGII